MLLIGQYDSPFVRRVAIALALYDLPFTHHPWSTFADADKIRPYNPLTRVPTLVLDDGEVISDSHCILQYLDQLAPADRVLWPRLEDRAHALAITALATGAADKAVTLFYERRMHREVSEPWVARCRGQITGALAQLEADRAPRTTEHWFGDRLGHTDVAVATMLRFVAEAHADLVTPAYPALSAHAARLEALPVFQRLAQSFKPPAT